MPKGLVYFFYSVFVVLLYFTNPIWADTFIDNNNGTVTDKGTGLVWQKGDSFHDLKNGLNWYDALEYITLKNSETFAGFDDWRLPTLTELNNLWHTALEKGFTEDELHPVINRIRDIYQFYLMTRWPEQDWPVEMRD